MQYGSLTLAEDTPVGYTLLTIKAEDADDPNSGSSQIYFHISAGDDDEVFTVETDGKGVGYLVVAKVQNLPHAHMPNKMAHHRFIVTCLHLMEQQPFTEMPDNGQ